IDSGGRLRYRGRIGNQIRLGGTLRGAGRSELQEAIEDVLAGRPVATAETPVDGCRITVAKDRTGPRGLTYHGDIAPLLAKHCTECHQAGTAAPLALQTYEDAASNAE